MNSFEEPPGHRESDGPGGGKDHSNNADDLERELTPPEDTAISPDLLDSLFDTEDPRVQSGSTDDDSDDDLDFIRMSGLTRPKHSEDTTAPPEAEELAPGSVSFYEPGVADVDAAMTPGAPASLSGIDVESAVADGYEIDYAMEDEIAGVSSQDDLSSTDTDAAFTFVAENPVDELIDVSSARTKPDPPNLVGTNKSADLPKIEDPRDRIEAAFEEDSAENAPEVIDLSALNDDDEDETTDSLPSEISGETQLDDAEPIQSVEPADEPEAEPLVSVVEEEEVEAVAAPAQSSSDEPKSEPSIFDGLLANTDHEAPQELPSVVGNEAKSDYNDDPYEDPATVQTFGRRSSRHHRRHQRSLPRVLKAAAVVIVFAAAIGIGGYKGYRWFEIQVANPTTLVYEAEAAAAAGQHLKASRLFEEFVRRHSDHPIAPDAMFSAGYEMQQVEPEDQDLARQYNEEALALLGEFTQRHPDHERAGRAQSLMGFVHYRMGDYRAAVDAFIERDAVLRDPVASLPMLRTLARSYAHMGDYEAAHTTFIRAANTPGNSSPDADYDELGEMYRSLAQNAQTQDDSKAYQELALEHWSHAIRYPGINPSRKNAIRVKVDLLGELGAIKGTPPTLAVQPVKTGLAVPLDLDAEPTSFEVAESLPIAPSIREVPGLEVREAAEIAIDSEVDNVQVVEGTPASTDFSAPIVDETVVDESPVPDAGESQLARYYEVAPGDQLYRIALDHGVAYADLMQWNAIDDANHIEVGQRLILQAPAPPTE